MPTIGDISTSKEIGRNEKGRHQYRKLIWHACIVCGKERWVDIRKGTADHQVCLSCNYKTRRKQDTRQTKEGYLFVWLTPDNFFYPMVVTSWSRNGGWVQGHRLVMAKSLGRCLQKWEIVHHKNGIKDDNRLENLELCSSLSQHSLDHGKGYKDGYVKGLLDGRNKQIEELRQEVKLLQWQLREQGVIK